MITSDDIDAFSEYQRKAWEFATPKAKCPPYLYGNLSAEVGEVMSLWAKSVRDGADPDEYCNSLQKELGDILWMVSGIATYYDMSLHDIAKGNIDKLTSRKQRNAIHGSGDNR